MTETSGPYVPYLAAHETHTGMVVLVGDRAAAHLSDHGGGPAEPIVVMRRHRDEDRLASRVRSDADEAVRDLLDAIAAVLARFHRGAERGAAISAQGQAGAIERRWRDNLTELDRHDATLPPGRCRGYGTSQGNSSPAGDRCSPSGSRTGSSSTATPTCSPTTSSAGPRGTRAARLPGVRRQGALRRLHRRRRMPRDGPGVLGPHSRAVVRAKVDCVRLSQGTAQAAADAAGHLAIAVEHLEAGGVGLALVGGNPGTGKSTLARALAERAGAQVISTDDVRRELWDSGVISGDPGLLDRGLYTPENGAAVYENALERARPLLGAGQSVILDGTWREPQLRAGPSDRLRNTLGASGNQVRDGG